VEDRVRVALVVAAYDPAVGGVEYHVRKLAIGLTVAGDDVTVVTHRLTSDQPATETREGVRVVRLPQVVSASAFRFSPAVTRYLRRTRSDFDVVHVHNYHTLVGVNAVAAGASPLVFTPHYHGTGHSFFRAMLHRPYRAIGRAVMERSAAVVCVTEAEAGLVRRHFPTVAARVRVIPNGARRISQKAAQDGRSPATQRDILTVGRLESYKGVDQLIRAMPFVPAPTRLIVVGDGPARDTLQNLAAAVGVAQRVTFTGRLPQADLDAALCTARVVASMSAQEAFGLCVADGLAGGASVVASDIPAHREVVDLAGGPKSARLVPRGDPAALRTALTDVVGASPQAARAPSTGLPTWEEIVIRTRELYLHMGRHSCS
jgi:glycosyltransferase involved in cell wall biosynthesis